MNDQKTPCPFVYSTGKKCDGCIDRWQVYGHRKGEPLYFAKKVRLWCDEKDDHAGTVSSWVSKERMEFYPNQLAPALYQQIEASI